MRLPRLGRLRTGAASLLATVITTVPAASLAGLSPAQAATPAATPTVARDQIACPRGFVCTSADINFNGQPYVKRAVDEGRPGDRRPRAVKITVRGACVYGS